MKKRRKISAFLSHDQNFSENEKWNTDFWKNVSDEDKFNAAIDLVKTAWITQGKKLNDLRLKRHIGLFKPS